MTQELQRDLVSRFYKALSSVDIQLFWSVQTENVIYNISGHSPISGRIKGQTAIIRDILPPVFSGLKLDTFQFSKKWKIVCQDENRIVCFMESDGHGLNGVRYDQRYVHVFGFEDGKINELWEFFDTALANAVLFTSEADVKRSPALQPFEF